jgi:hypothetical protein
MHRAVKAQLLTQLQSRFVAVESEALASARKQAELELLEALRQGNNKRRESDTESTGPAKVGRKTARAAPPPYPL